MVLVLLVTCSSASQTTHNSRYQVPLCWSKAKQNYSSVWCIVHTVYLPPNGARRAWCMCRSNGARWQAPLGSSSIELGQTIRMRVDHGTT